MDAIFDFDHAIIDLNDADLVSARSTRLRTPRMIDQAHRQGSITTRGVR
jgi:hypothetical protein